jgi:hypothetical protein
MKVLLFLVATTLCSCATILTGTTQKINFKSTPPNAEVYLNDKKIGTTDNDITITNWGLFDSPPKITYKLDGYKDLDFVLEPTVIPTYWIGIFFLGFPCLFDVIAGNLQYSEYENYQKTLEKK